MGTTMDVRDVGVALWRQRLLVLLVLLVTGLAAAVGVDLAPKGYTATASVRADRAQGSTRSAEDLDGLRGTVADLARSNRVAAAVSASLDGRRSAGQLREEIRGRWVRGSTLVAVDVEDRDSALAARIADLVAARLVADRAGGDDLVLEVADGAARPSSYSTPDLRLVILVALLVGIGLAAAAAVARDRRTHTVDDAATVEDAASAPLLAHLGPPTDLTEMPALEPGTAAADVFRHLRNALESETVTEGRGPAVIAAIGPGDLNVWLGANVAIALADAGRRVLLVDGRMGERFGRPIESEPDTPGLYDVLLGAAELGSAMSPGPVERLSVLPSGTWGEKSVEELIRRRFAEVMAVATSEFDTVLVLGPPLEVCDDARVMAIGASLVLVVVEREVSAHALRVHADRIRSAGARLAGVVLVGRAPRRSRRPRVSEPV